MVGGAGVGQDRLAGDGQKFRVQPGADAVVAAKQWRLRKMKAGYRPLG